MRARVPQRKPPRTAATAHVGGLKGANTMFATGRRLPFTAFQLTVAVSSEQGRLCRLFYFSSRALG